MVLDLGNREWAELLQGAATQRSLHDRVFASRFLSGRLCIGVIGMGRVKVVTNLVRRQKELSRGRA